MQRLSQKTFNKKPNIDKLRRYGFVKSGDLYAFSSEIASGTFCLDIFVSAAGIAEYRVIDKATDEEYAPAYNENAVGAFVGSVRSECMKILDSITLECFEPDVFKSDYAKKVIEYIRDRYGADAEYLWEKFPDNAIFREEKTQKWYAALLTVEQRKLGIDENGTIEIIDLKEAPDLIAALVDGKKYFAGYHMNKKHWYTICLDGSVPIEEIFERIDISFNTLKKGKEKC